MDASKPGKGILASLAHKAAAQPRRNAAATLRGPALIVVGGVLIAALMAWWVYSGPSPLRVQEAPAFVAPVAAPLPAPAPETDIAAAIIEDVRTPAPVVSSPAVAAVLAPAPIATVVMRRERTAAAKPAAKPLRKPPRHAPAVPTARPAVQADSDVALLTALVAHSGEHDVVEARLMDSTESLLLRCQRVGGEEGRLCRTRICRSRQNDDACRTQ